MNQHFPSRTYTICSFYWCGLYSGFYHSALYGNTVWIYSVHTTPIQSILPCTVVQLNTQALLSIELCFSYNVLLVSVSICSIVFTSVKSPFVKSLLTNIQWVSIMLSLLKHDRAAADRTTNLT